MGCLPYSWHFAVRMKGWVSVMLLSAKSGMLRVPRDESSARTVCCLYDRQFSTLAPLVRHQHRQADTLFLERILKEMRLAG